MRIKGSELKPETKKLVLNQFVHRFTGEHKPSWANKPMANGKPYPIQFLNDTDWLENTYFIVKKNGDLNNRYKYWCHSNPTWPFNPELRNNTIDS